VYVYLVGRQTKSDEHVFLVYGYLILGLGIHKYTDIQSDEQIYWVYFRSLKKDVLRLFASEKMKTRTNCHWFVYIQSKCMISAHMNN
jgi:hypothetical protein